MMHVGAQLCVSLLSAIELAFVNGVRTTSLLLTPVSLLIRVSMRSWQHSNCDPILRQWCE
jgi:hypothetical protein